MEDKKKPFQNPCSNDYYHEIIGLNHYFAENFPFLTNINIFLRICSPHGMIYLLL